MSQHQPLRRISAAIAIPATAVLLAGCGSSSTSSATPATPTPSVTASAAPVASMKPVPQTFVLTEHDTKTVYTPKGGVPTTAGPQGQPKTGDHLAVTAQVLRGTAVVGSLNYSDVFEAGNRVLIKGTTVLAKGQITVDGLVALVEPTVMPIVSGTGAYAGLTGTLTAEGVSAHDAKLTFMLR